MKNVLAKLLPLLTLIIAAPSFAAGNYSNHNYSLGQIAESPAENFKEQHLNDLNLTPKQKIEIAQLRALTHAQIGEILTREQLQELAQLKDPTLRDNWEILSLNPTQKVKIDAIRHSSQQQFYSFLTPAQQAKFKSHKHNYL